MRTLLLAALAAVIVVGCSSAPEVRFRTRAVDGFTPEEGAASTFRPLVVASTETPRCEDLRSVPGALGSRTLSWIYGDPQHQRVTVSLDANGDLLHYSDGRGDANASREEDFTSIIIDFGSDRAMGLNRLAGSGGVQATRMTVEDALQAENLGNPQAVIDRILAECPEPGD